MKTITIGISPCPNDTFIFHALLHELVPLPFKLKYILADVEELNARAVQGELFATKISAGVLPKVLENYAVLQSGGALGFGCGPLIISKKKLTPAEQAKASIAIPGSMTTANLLLQTHGAFHGQRHEMVFDQIIPAVLDGKIDMGLIIHEGRFTYAQYGLHKILDLGEWWEQSYNLPLPLGCIAVRRDLPKDMALALETGIAQSILYARKHPQASHEFIHTHAQELSQEVTTAHIKTFVNDYSISLGDTGKDALRKLLSVQTQETSLNSIFLEK